MTSEASDQWRIWIDTGGTFTDCLGLTPDGEVRRVKVLSSAALRGRVTDLRPTEGRIHFAGPSELPTGFCLGATLRPLRVEENNVPSRDLESTESTVTGADEPWLTLDRWPTGLVIGDAVELLFDEEAPILAARLLTGTADRHRLPPLAMRLATTRGTNALLERRGARTAWLVTAGFGDLLRIGEQHRPDLFARHVRRPPPIYDRSVEVEERLDAEGRIIRPLDEDDLRGKIDELRRAGIESVAVSLMHSYLNPAHEQRVAELLREAGFEHVSCSAELTPTLKLLPRARTACVDAYLSPVVGRYLDRVASVVGERRLTVMTSAGGLVQASAYRAKDSLLSGPAGGVVGAARCGAEHGFERVIAFDMGGTSTDVSRVQGDFDYAFEHTVGDVTLAAPALRIETVAAGGGSICSADSGVLKVGPESAGAFPGPACYGAGGPLTLTDVHLLLGRLDPRRFEIPIDVSAAEVRADEVLDSLRQGGSSLDRDSLLLGYLAIADQRMADAVRRISVRQGYDPSGDALVAFGGAGGLHACAVAEPLGMSTVLWPREAGLLSAYGLGAASLECMEEEQVLEPLAECGPGLAERLRTMAARAEAGWGRRGAGGPRPQVRRRLAYLRFLGQESTLEIELDSEPDPVAVAAAFAERYRERYGYVPAHREVERRLELESLRLVLAADAPLRQRRALTVDPPETLPPARPHGTARAFFGGTFDSVPIFEMEDLSLEDLSLKDLLPEQRLDGPALVFDRHASFVLPPGWQASVSVAGALVARRRS